MSLFSILSSLKPLINQGLNYAAKNPGAIASSLASKAQAVAPYVLQAAPIALEAYKAYNQENRQATPQQQQQQRAQQLNPQQTITQQQLDPQQQNAQQYLLNQLMQQNPQFQREEFGPIAEEEQRRYQQQIVPGLAERFTSLGGGRSSAFQQSLRGAGEDLQARLAALRSRHNIGQQQAELAHRGLGQRGLGALSQYLIG